MAALVVDTDVVSCLLRPRDSRAPLYRPHLRGVVAIISFQTLAELHRWALERNWGAARQAALARHLQQFAVQPWDPALCIKWAEVRVQCKRIGNPIDAADAWQAATALYLDLPLLTHNRRHYARVPGLQIISHAP
jgi:predicted nucleic acid-binding protein